MSKEKCHEIACLFEHTNVTQDEVEAFYGVDFVKRRRKKVEFMRSCIRSELQAMVDRGAKDSLRRIDESFKETFECMQARAWWGDLLLIFTVSESSWRPSDPLHLRYLISRASTRDCYSAFVVELQSRIQAAKAVEAVASILRSQG